MKKYKNKDKKCECGKCELSSKCLFAFRAERLPDNEGLNSLCPKLKIKEIKTK